MYMFLSVSSTSSYNYIPTGCVVQLAGISGRPLSLNTRSLMLSTQGCSHTLEPNGGS